MRFLRHIFRKKGILFYNIISLSCHEQVCLSGLRFERYFSHHRADDARSISRPMMGEVSLET